MSDDLISGWLVQAFYPSGSDLLFGPFDSVPEAEAFIKQVPYDCLVVPMFNSKRFGDVK